MTTRRSRRCLEVFLDLVSSQVDRGVGYLLDDSYAGLLDDADRRLAGHLAGIVEDAEALRGCGSWPAVAALLHSLGTLM